MDYPTIFIALMGLAVLVYALLDGYDLGVGILLPADSQPQRDLMIASIGPFWDANETWLVLAVGLLLIAFPDAHSLVLKELYLPTAFMLIGLILRGVAFDFRVKAAMASKAQWDMVFRLGSWITALTQGYMLGRYVMGFEPGLAAQGFSVLSALGVTAAYSMIGAAWLIWKTENQLQQRAVIWAKRCVWISLAGIVAVSVVNPLVNPSVFARWFTFPLVMFVLLIPILCLALFGALLILLPKLPMRDDRFSWLPMLLVAGIFLLNFIGLAFSFYPEIVPGHMTIWEASADPSALSFVLVGALIVVPFIIVYTLIAYYVFRGKSSDLSYT